MKEDLSRHKRSTSKILSNMSLRGPKELRSWKLQIYREIKALWNEKIENSCIIWESHWETFILWCLSLQCNIFSDYPCEARGILWRNWACHFQDTHLDMYCFSCPLVSPEITWGFGAKKDPCFKTWKKFPAWATWFTVSRNKKRTHPTKLIECPSQVLSHFC